VPYFPNHAIIERLHQKECPSAEVKGIVCIDQYGECCVYIANKLCIKCVALQLVADVLRMG
jgi:hypothetical protein